MLPMMLLFSGRNTDPNNTHSVFWKAINISILFGRNTDPKFLTTHTLYIQSIRVVYGDKIVKYDLAIDSNQEIKRDFTGPLGVRLFDKAVMYQSSTLYILMCLF
jgi:hypothetical protein